MGRAAGWLPALVMAAVCVVAPAAAQTAEDGPAFSLSSSEVFTSREDPSFYLTFRRLSQLDFRVYRVRDAAKFFTGLADPHQLGSYGVPVPVEKSWIERLTDWKRDRRRQIRSFVREQVSAEYRGTRRAARERQDAARRVTLNRASFAQVPMLNPDQLVTAWREVLPNLAESEMRRLPLEVKEPGIYVVEAVSGALRAYTIVMVSDIGLVTKVAASRMMIFAADRQTGEPHAGCTVDVFVDGRSVVQGTTDADGLLESSVAAARAGNVLTLAACGTQVAVADPGGYFLGRPDRELAGYVYTDKPIYRPGHTVNLKAILRWRARDALQPFGAGNVEVRISDPGNKVIFRRSVAVDEFGAIQASLVLPPESALGYYSVAVVSGEFQAAGAFSVQEYRRPEFEVIVTPVSRFVVQGRAEAVASVRARYYFGQPVANALVRYSVARSPYESPLRWTDEFESSGDGSGGAFYGGEEQIRGEIRLDAAGQGEIRLPAAVDPNRQDYSLNVTAAVIDASSREVSETTTIHATHASFLIAAEVIGGYLFRPGQGVTLAVRALDYMNAPTPGVPVSVTLEHRSWPNGYYRPSTVRRIGSTSLTLDATGSGTVSMTLGAEPGNYSFVVEARDADRTVSTSASAWVPGGVDSGSDGDRFLELIADKKTYAPGDTAQLVIRGEQVAGPVLLTKEGRDVTWRRLVRVRAGEPFIIPIEPGDAGDIFVSVLYLRDGRLNRADRRLVVPADERTLRVSIEAESAVARPQQAGTFMLTVTDAVGAPVRAQISLGVIDEAVYAIARDTTPDPVRAFYQREYTAVSTSFSRNYYFYGYAGADRLQLAGRRRRPFTLADFKGDPDGRPQVRKDFPDAIYWIADIVTDARGTARVSLKYPDALTTWRLTARAVTTDTRLGSTIARTTTTKDLIVRVITPRFLTQGDEVILPTVVHNYLPEAQDATITFAATGLQPAPGAPTAAVTAAIPSRGERRDDWRLVAANAGTAVVTGAARTTTESDAVELPIPVLPRGLRREAGVSGSLAAAGEAAAAVTIPAASNTAGRCVRVSLAPSMAGSMLGALDFLTSYPYGCTEQTLSSFLPNLVVTRALGQLSLVPPERVSALGRQTADGLRRLLELQQDDGGWGWWRTDATHPFMTAYALYGLVEARREGLTVDDQRVAAAVRALEALYGANPRAEPDLKAYMAFVLGRAGAAGSGRVRLDELWEARTRMSAYGRALLLMTLDAAGDARGNDLAPVLMAEARTTGELSFWQSEQDRLLSDFADTTAEATATAVRALARRDPRNPTLDRAVRWLMLNRSAGYWSSTKQTAMVLYGLLELLQARNETPQPFTADVFINDTLAGSHTFTPASLANPDPVAITAAGSAGANRVRIVKRGGGTLYWSATGVYYDTQAAAARAGTRQLAVSRRYALLSPVRQPNGTFIHREQPLGGPIQPGDVLTVRLTVAGSTDWRYLLLEDPLPAGVEAIQDNSAYAFESDPAWWYGSRVEYRDNRTVFFQPDMTAGRYEFVYLVRAISSGQFTAIPAQVTPMYVPDVAASSEPMSLIVAAPGASR